MEITCLDRYDHGIETVDISDMSNHSERESSNNNIIEDVEESSYDDEDNDLVLEEDDRTDDESRIKNFVCWFRANYFDIVRGIGNDLLIKTTVTFSQIPELISYAFIAGVQPEMALHSAWIMGMITSIIHGKPLISGMTGSIACILSKLVQDTGIEYVYYTVILAGIFQIIFGFLKFDVIFKLVSYPVYVGYLTSVGLLVAIVQLNYFKVQPDSPSQDIMQFQYNNFSKTNDEYPWVDMITCIIMIFEILATILICVFIPQVTRSTKIPANVVAIPIIAMFEFGAIRPLGYQTPLISDLYTIQKTSPTFIFTDDTLDLPPFFNIDTMKKIISSSILVFMASLIDTFLTATLVDELMSTSKKEKDKLAIGQGIGQFTSGFFGGMGGATMIFQTFLNVKSGSLSGLSTFAAGLSLLCIISFAYPVINIIPLASIVGVMLYAVFSWILSFILPERIRLMLHLPICKLRGFELSTVVLVIIISCIFGLEFGVIIGVLLSLLDFTFQAGKRLEIRRELEVGAQNSIYHITGPIYFGSSQDLLKEFSLENMKNSDNPDGIILSLEGAEVFDHTGLQALHKISQDLSCNLDKTVAFADVSPATKKMMEQTASMWESMYFLEYKDLENPSNSEDHRRK